MDAPRFCDALVCISGEDLATRSSANGCVSIGQQSEPFTIGSRQSMSEKKPQPLNPPKRHDRCPVCGEASYSLAGVHPQCSVRRADEKHKNGIKLVNLLANEAKSAGPVGGVTPRQKNCPECNLLQHIQKVVCGCGHTFAITERPPSREGERP